MGEFVTGEAARERLDVLADQVDAAYAEMWELCSADVGNAFRTGFAELLEAQERANRGLMYRFFGQIADPPDETAMAPSVVNSLAGAIAHSAERGQAPDEDGGSAVPAPSGQRAAAAGADAVCGRRDGRRTDR